MALPILDGNQSATTLSSILTSGEHIPAHTVVSLGTQAITDMRGAVSGSVVSISNFPATQTIAGTVTANIDNVSANLTGVDTPRPQQGIALGYLTDSKQFFASVDEDNGLPVRIAGDSQTQSIFGTVTVGNSVTIASLPLIAGTVTANLGNAFINTSGGYQPVQFSTGLPVANERDGITFDAIPFLVAGSVTIGSALPAGTNRIGVVTIGNIQRSGDGAQSSLLTEAGSGYLNTRSYIGEGTAQIGSVTASISGTVPISISSVTVGNSVTIGSLPLIAGTVTVSNAVELAQALLDQSSSYASLDVNIGGVSSVTLPIAGTVTVGSLPDGVAFGEQLAEGFQNYGGIDIINDLVIGTFNPSVTAFLSNSVTISSLPALVAGTAQIGSVTASISNSVTIASFATSVTARLINPAGTAVTYAEVGTAGSPSIDVLSVQGVTSGTAIPISISSVTIGSLPAISGTVTANTFALQGTAVTTSNFTSTTASTVLANYNATREVLTIFNEGAGNLHICAGATCTTIAYQVRLSAGDYYEVPNHQTTITHSAVFATAGTARVTEVS